MGTKIRIFTFTLRFRPPRCGIQTNQRSKLHRDNPTETWSTYRACSQANAVHAGVSLFVVSVVVMGFFFPLVVIAVTIVVIVAVVVLLVFVVVVVVVVLMRCQFAVVSRFGND